MSKDPNEVTPEKLASILLGMIRANPGIFNQALQMAGKSYQVEVAEMREAMMDDNR